MSDEVKKKDRLFFHDVINQTHGINLFLSSKASLDSSEIELLKNEVRTLQALIQSHFGLTHKNLNDNENQKGAQEKIRASLDKLIELYFPQAKESMVVNFKGEEGAEVDFIVLYRILNNLVKNMAEAKVSESHFCLNFTEQGLSVETKNPILDKNAFKDRKGQGLDSIALLANENGGFFQYEIHQDQWLNHIFLPYKNSSSIKKIAA